MDSEEQKILKKLERINQDQEMLLKQLQALSKEERIKSIEGAVDKTLERVNSSQMIIIEKVNNVQNSLDKIAGNHSRISYEQKELKVEITNKTYLQNELSKDLDELNSFIKSGRSPAKLVATKLNDISKDVFMIGVQQNAFTAKLEEYKTKLRNEIQKMTLDLCNVIDKKADLSDQERANLLNKVKSLNSNTN